MKKFVASTLAALLLLGITPLLATDGYVEIQENMSSESNLDAGGSWGGGPRPTPSPDPIYMGNGVWIIP